MSHGFEELQELLPEGVQEYLQSIWSRRGGRDRELLVSHDAVTRRRVQRQLLVNAPGGRALEGLLCLLHCRLG